MAAAPFVKGKEVTERARPKVPVSPRLPAFGDMPIGLSGGAGCPSEGGVGSLPAPPCGDLLPMFGAETR